jgi:type II restriction enzyme
VELGLPTAGLDRYKSRSQRARVATEGWARENLYCLNCDSNRLVSVPTGTPVIDYICPRCESPFQLKSQSHSLGERLVDAAYAAMSLAIREDRTPNLFALHYERERWKVVNVIVIPRFAFSFSALEKRKPLGPSARRAGWVGCNIVLSKIPLDARIPLVVDGTPQSPGLARKRYSRIRPLAKLKSENRGWTLDVLNLMRSLGREEFSLSDAYSFESQLASLHPANRHIRDKIRQQLQVLRDLGMLKFLGGGKYSFR